MHISLRAGLAAAALSLTAVPAIAQDIGPAPGGPGMAGNMGGKGMRQIFEKMSPEGRTTMWNALKAVRDDGSRDGIKAARDRMLTILDAERLDTAALQRAMLEERNLSQGQHQRMQEALLGAFQKLSLEDRRAFVAGSREAKAWMEERRGQGREMRKQQR